MKNKIFCEATLWLFSDCIFDFALKYEIGYDAIFYQAENTHRVLNVEKVQNFLWLIDNKLNELQVESTQ